MSATNELLDKSREVCSLKSDAALARKFGVTPAAVSNYRQGIRHPEPEFIDALARAIGQPPLEWALRIQAEREERINPRRAKVWLRWSKQVAGAAAAIALIFVALHDQANQDALAALILAARNPDSVYYVKYRIHHRGIDLHTLSARALVDLGRLCAGHTLAKERHLAPGAQCGWRTFTLADLAALARGSPQALPIVRVDFVRPTRCNQS